MKYMEVTDCFNFLFRDYVRLTWNTGHFLAVMFVVINMVAQIAGCVMVLLRKFVPVAVGILFGVIVLQVS